MKTGHEDLQQSLIEAFLMEKGTRIFYDEAAEKAVNPAARETFQELSHWEEKHMDYIQFLYQSISGEKSFATFEEFRKAAEAPLTEAGIPIKDLEHKIEKYSFSDEMGALTLALEIEGKAYNFYRKLSNAAEDSNAKVIFSEMVHQELKHVESLKKLRVKLADTLNN